MPWYIDHIQGTPAEVAAQLDEAAAKSAKEAEQREGAAKAVVILKDWCDDLSVAHDLIRVTARGHVLPDQPFAFEATIGIREAEDH